MPEYAERSSSNEDPDHFVAVALGDPPALLLLALHAVLPALAVDTGELLPDGRTVSPRRPAAPAV
ncbi:hypothetical protein [Streptomyces sp. NPDC048385]|uniref:hypothetical protein n=1 Tax=unclassified Streptomyces TaxID=2593676 RepID=UPI0034433F68